MKIFGFFVDQSKRLMALGVIVLILLTSAFGVVSGDEPEENKELLDCLCSCLEPPGGQFSCCYNTEDRGWSPSCRDLSNGPCICKAYGCFRRPLPTEGECYDNCYAKYAQEKPEDEEGEEKQPTRFINPKHLEKFLRSQGYDESACPKKGDPPPGSVKFWSKVPGGGIAHSSVMLSNNRQIEMGHKPHIPGSSEYMSEILLEGKKPKPRRGNYSLQKTLCPPPTYHFDNDCSEKMEGIDREYGTSKQWNCHGFSARVVYNCVETGIRMKPITDFDWKGKTLVLNMGEVWGDVIPLTIQIPQGAVQFGSEYTIEVRTDNTTIIYLIKGKADYKGIGQSLSLSSGQMALIDPTGTPSAPTTFNISELDLWWTGPQFFMKTSQEKEGLTFESHSKPSGSSVQIPLTLKGIEDKIGNMDITLSYDSSVLEATAVTKGDLTSDSLFEYNIMAGTILISLADAEGFSGNGTIAYVTFNVIGAADSTSPLQIATLAANRAEDYEVLTIPINDGLFRVIIISTEESGGLTVSVSDTTGAKGSTVEVPINLEGATEVGSMDIVLTYDADVLRAVDVEAGALGKNALIEANTARDGEVIIALADSSGINGDGTVAIVTFEVIGDAGTTSALTLEAVSVHNLDLGEIIPNTEIGTFLVI
ncbi:hypothetical protein C4E22_04760 [ANME-1 cluster archaeon AG-394-G06]|nr:hypothetical protein [ANME-1 cluster archaeon AG-394-G06]